MVAGGAAACLLAGSPGPRRLLRGEPTGRSPYYGRADARLSISTARLWAEGLEAPLRLVRESGLGLEISLHPGYLLDEALFEALARLVHRPSVHLPHQGLDPLSPNPEIGALSLRRASAFPGEAFRVHGG